MVPGGQEDQEDLVVPLQLCLEFQGSLGCLGGPGVQEVLVALEDHWGLEDQPFYLKTQDSVLASLPTEHGTQKNS